MQECKQHGSQGKKQHFDRANSGERHPSYREVCSGSRNALWRGIASGSPESARLAFAAFSCHSGHLGEPRMPRVLQGSFIGLSQMS